MDTYKFRSKLHVEYSIKYKPANKNNFVKSKVTFSMLAFQL